MALVGEAHIVVRAITRNIDKDIQSGFKNSSRTFDQAGERAGNTFSKGFSRGINRNYSNNAFGRLTQSIDRALPNAIRAREAFQKLVTTGYTLGTTIGGVVGAIGALSGGLGGLVGVAGGAAASLAVVANSVFALGAAMLTARLALSGIGKAVSAINNAGGGGGGGGGSAVSNIRAVEEAEKALARVIERNREALLDANDEVRDSQIRLNEAIKEGREEIQQLGFDSEDAALAEQRAAIDLEKARETLARMQDLPPNSRPRREAELAYQEAELNYRQAKDKAADLAAEQDRLAKTGVAGTQVVIDATNALAEAEANRAKVVRDGLRDEADARENLEDARKPTGGGGGGGGGGNDPFAGLNDAQIRFAKFIASLKPQFDELKRIAAESFLPDLQSAIQNLMTLAFPTVARGIGLVGAALGITSIHLSNVITEAENLRDLNSAFEQSTTVIQGLGRVLGNVWDSFMSIIAAATPLTERFVRFIESKTGTFASFLDAKQATGELEDFFNRSGELMADFGEIFGNFFAGLGALVKINFGPGSGGQFLLTWLKDTTQGFADMDRSVQSSAEYFEYFNDTARNTASVLGAIGQALRDIGAVGDNRNIGETFDILKSGSPYLQTLLEALVDSGPALAYLVRELTELVAKTTDMQAISTYFDTIRSVLSLINSLLDNELIFNLVTVVGQIAAVGLAFKTITGTAIFFGNVVGGVFRNFTNLVGRATGSLTGPGGFNSALAATGKAGGGARGGLAGLAGFLGGPWGVALAGATLLVTGMATTFDAATRSTDALEAALRGAADAATIIESASSKKGIFGLYDVQIANASEGLNDLSNSLDEISQQRDSLGWLQDAGYNIASVFGGTNKSGGALLALQQIGAQLKTVAGSDLASAQKSFALLAEKTDGSTKELWQLLSTTSDYREELRKQLLATGDITAGMSEVAEKQVLINYAMGTGKFATEELTESYRDLGNQQRTLNSDSRSYYETLDTVTAAIREQRDAYLQANGTMEGFKATMDVTTEAGRDNQAMIDGLAASTQALSDTTLEQTGSQQEANKVILEGRQALIDQMIQMGYTKAEAQAYADKLGLIPKQITTKMYLDTAEASWRLDEWLKNANNNINAALSGARYSGMAAAQGRAGANGMFNDHRNPIQSFASGGFPTGIFNGGAPIYKFAEPETNWEAFISGRRGQEERNRAVATEALNRLGGPTAGPNISIQVVAAPGMNTTELAEEVSRIISFNTRKGGWS